MKIQINGETREVQSGVSVHTLLEGLGIDPARCVVERNGDILARERFEEQILEDDDVLEVVRFVGGG